MKILDLFAGIGGFSYAAHFLGIGETTQFVEINPYCQKVLAKNFPNVPIHDDITTFNPLRGEYDIITFGSPCQDVSSAGKQKGIHGDRSGLFFHAVRIIKQVEPKGFIMENVIGIRKWQEAVLDELQTVRGYDLYWFSVSVKELGGCHKRERWFCIGWRDSTNPQSLYGQTRGDATNYPKDKQHLCENLEHNRNKIRSKFTGCDRMGGSTDNSNPDKQRCKGLDDTRKPQGWTQFDSPHLCESENRSAEKEIITRICGGDDGLPLRLDLLINQLMSPAIAHKHIEEGTASDERKLKDRSKRIQALGNAVTPQQAGVCFYLLYLFITD